MVKVHYDGPDTFNDFWCQLDDKKLKRTAPKLDM